MVRSVDFLYSLYDALVSINVPNDKARAVVEAMERDMATHLATKPDLDHHRLALKGDLDRQRVELRADLERQRVELKADIERQRVELKADLERHGAEIERLRLELKGDLERQGVELRAEIGVLRKDMDTGFQLLRKDMDSLRARLTIQFGSMLVVMTGLVLAMLRLG
jgi:hypothetical protein